MCGMVDKDFVIAKVRRFIQIGQQLHYALLSARGRCCCWLLFVLVCRRTVPNKDLSSDV